MMQKSTNATIGVGLLPRYDINDAMGVAEHQG